MDCLQTKMRIVYKILRKRFPELKIRYNKPYSISVISVFGEELLFSDIDPFCFLTLSSRKDNVLSSHMVERVWYAYDLYDLLWIIQRFSIIQTLRLRFDHDRVPSLKTIAFYQLTTLEVTFARSLTVSF